MVRTILKLLLALPAILVLAVIVVINVRLLIEPPPASRSARLYKELKRLQVAMNDGADNDMQRLYPEGYVFLNAIYGLAWYNFRKSAEGELHANEAHIEMSKAWNRINSHLGRSTFSEELPLSYGAFYRGWNNYLLAKKLSMENPAARNPLEVNAFLASCDSISKAITANPYPASYYGASWPADGLMCIASLSAYDELYPPRYQEVIKTWMAKVRANLDDHGLIPHIVHPGTGRPAGSSRGSSQSLMLIVLKDVDEAFAQEQFILFKSNFIDTRFGLVAVREFPKDQFGVGDVDSGPLILGFGTASTIVGMQTASVFGDLENAASISRLIDAAGFPIETSEGRNYLFGVLPIADAFIAWGHSTPSAQPSSNPSFARFHVYSCLCTLMLLAFVWILLKPNKPDSARSLSVDW